MWFLSYMTKCNGGFQLTNQASETVTTVFSLWPQPPSHTAHQQACVSDNISDKCPLSSEKYETPLETKQAFPQSAAQAELLHPDAACKDAGTPQVSHVCPN